MRVAALYIAIAVVVIGFVAWSAADDDVQEEIGVATESAERSMAEKWNDGQKAAENIDESLGFDSRQTAFRKAEERIQALQSKLANWSDNARQTTTKTREELEIQIDKLKETLAAAKKATAEEWDQVRKDLARAYEQTSGSDQAAE